jgi:hypothetical protein
MHCKGAEDLPDKVTVPGGGLVVVGLNVALASSWFKQVMVGWSVSLGEVQTRASGRMYPATIPIDRWKRSCSTTMKPVLSVEALPRMYSQFSRTWADVIVPAWMLKSGREALVRFQGIAIP